MLRKSANGHSVTPCDTTVAGTVVAGSKEKPDKPYPDFPLHAHSSGKWAKRIKGKVRYFGRWDDPDGALDEFKRFMAAGEPPRPATPQRRPSAVTLGEAANRFLIAKRDAADTGTITERTFKEYQAAVSRFVASVGRDFPLSSIGPEHFSRFRVQRARALNIVTIGNEVTRIRSLFKWLHGSDILKTPPRFGPDFKKPGKRVLRIHRREQGKKLFTPEQIHDLLDEAGIHLRAMIALGINCGFGPGDCAHLPVSAVDLESGWIDYPRPKTAVDRLCPLWPETTDMLSASLRRRKTPLDDSCGAFFVTRFGKPWSNDQSALSKYFTAVRKRVLDDGGMYWLRRTFETVAGACGDQVAVDAIMGHVDNSMAAVYRQEVQKDRLIRASNTVREWLFEDNRPPSPNKPR